MEKRTQIIFETLGAIGNERGPDYGVFIKRQCSDEWDENGLTEEESLYVAMKFVDRWEQGELKKPRCIACGKGWDINGNGCFLSREFA